MIFNVGARRSGTYWLQRITCAHPAVAEVPTETYVFSHGIAPLMERFHHGDRDHVDVGLVYADRTKLIAAIRSLCDTVFGEFASEAGQQKEWRDEHRPGQGHQRLRIGSTNLEEDQEDERVLQKVVVEGGEELAPEEGRKAPGRHELWEHRMGLGMGRLRRARARMGDASEGSAEACAGLQLR